MLLREMTISAYARTFKRIAQCAVAGLALSGLVACGGGGGGTAAPTTPQMRIKPVDFASAIEAAPTITSGETVTGTLESADDVKYYRLQVDETSIIELTLDAEAGIEIALLDSYEAVLVTAVTESEVSVRIMAVASEYIVRIKGSVGYKRVQGGFKLVAKATAVADNAETVINLIQGIPDYKINVLGAGVELDLTDYVRGPDGQVPEFRTAKFGVSAPGLAATVERTTLGIRPNSQAGPGFVRIVVYASIPGIPGFPIPFSVELGAEGLRVKPDVGRAHGPQNSFIVPAGGSINTDNLSDYFEYQIEASIANNVLFTNLVRGWDYTAVIRPDSDGGSVTGWTAEVAKLTEPFLTVGAPSGTETVPTIVVDVTVKDRFGSTAKVPLTFIAAEEEPATPPSPTSIDYACTSIWDGGRADGELADCVEHFHQQPPRTLPILCPPENRVAQCPRTGTEYAVIISCRYEGDEERFSYRQHTLIPTTDISDLLSGDDCRRLGGEFFIHKRP